MDGFNDFWGQTDAVGRAVALLLLAMSVVSWALIFWKTWVLRRLAADLPRALEAYWAAPDWALARDRLASLDREGVALPLLDAAQAHERQGSLAQSVPAAAQCTRRLRQALQGSLAHLRMGQVLLASVGSTSPFIGLFGTVWGIYHALVEMSLSGAVSVDKVSGPVGEALIMTAAGLAVAIPAVLGYNLFGKWISTAEEQLEGYAHDLLAAMSEPQA
ncbi:MAG: MotA/TolQ/ExbB proton channel family protein [Betaproteobacteria bacterium]|nr:MotA/TolQ/ExbB proton channel family protein [Betaproteobacteria bacterium]